MANEYKKAYQKVIENVSKAEFQIQEALQAAKSGVSRPSEVKVIKDLKPFELTEAHKPSELTDWMETFESYYEVSNLRTTALHIQRRFFLKNLNTTLKTYCKEHIKDDTPVFGPTDSCYAILLKRFESKYPIFYKRVMYFTYKQEGNNSTDFCTELSNLAKEADIEGLTPDDIHIFRIITGLNDQRLREKLLKLDKPTLEQVEQTCMMYETSKVSVRACNKTENASVAFTKAKNNQNHHKNNQPKSQNSKKNCWNCGRDNHSNKEQCPAKGKTCSYCKKEGHFKSDKNGTPVCFEFRKSLNLYTARHHNKSNSGKSKTYAIVTKTMSVEDYLPMPKVPIIVSAPNRKSFKVEALPDTGATRTLIPWRIAKKNNLKLEACDVRLSNASGKRMNVRGATKFQISYGPSSITINALVSEDLRGSDMLLSCHSMRDLGMLPPNFPSPLSDVSKANATSSTNESAKEKELILEEFKDILVDTLDEGAGPMLGKPMDIELVDGKIKPLCINTARKTPIHLQAQAKDILDGLMKAGIIKRQTKATDWCSPAHFVEKSPNAERPEADARLVIDFTNLNKYVKHPVHPFQSPHDLMKSLPPEAKVFCKLDCLHGYFQIPLSEESQDLTMFLLPEGRFYFTRNPQGLSAAGDIFNQKHNQIVEDLEWILKIVDDILIFAPTYEELYKRI